MKAMIIFSLLVSSSAFAQALQMSDFKKILTSNQQTLEQIRVGMTKKNSSISKIATDKGFCELEQTAIQTILSIEGKKIIVYSKESQLPKATPACAGFDKTTNDVIFYESAPSLSDDIAALDVMEKDVKNIVKDGSVVTIETNDATLKYDVSKSSFKNLILYQNKSFISNTSEMIDLDVNTFNLSNILFCESATSDVCMEGDFSDILF